MRELQRSALFSPFIELLTAAPRVRAQSERSGLQDVYFERWDSQRALRTRTLNNKVIMLFGKQCQITFSAKVTAQMSPFCRRCLRWGHVMKECRTVMVCAWCGGPHTKEQHRAACGQCNSRKLPPEKRTPAGMECPHPLLCVNCGEAHMADGLFTKVYYQGGDGTHYTKKIQCPFWKVKFRNGAWKTLYEQVHAQQVLQRESSGTNTPPRFPPRSTHPV